MKRVLFILCLLSSFIFLTKAQGTLEFNQVKVVTTSETVPAGKVWKVVSVFASSDMTTTSGTTNTKYSKNIVINGATVYVFVRSYTSYQGNGIDSGHNTELPIWLPEGATLASSGNANGISVIEFNVL